MLSRPKIRLSLGTKLNLILIASFGFLLLMTLVIINNSILNFVLQTGQQRVQQETNLLLNRFREAEQQLRSNAQIIGTTPEMIENVTANNAFRSRITAQLAATQFNLDDVSIINSQHELLLSTLYPERFDETATDYLQTRQALFSYGLVGINTTDVVLAEGKNGRELLIVGTAPIQNKAREIVGSILVIRRINERFLAQLNFLRKDIHLALVYQGEVLTRRDVNPATKDTDTETQLLGGDSVLDNGLLLQALSGPTVVTDQFNFDPGTNTPYVMALAPFKIGGEIIGAVIIQWELQQLIGFQQQLLITLTVLISVLALLVTATSAVFARKGIVQPLERLKRVSDQMAQGDYSQRAAVVYNDEIGQLSLTFNEMSDAIHKRELELRVAIEKATEVARVKGQFLATMSHELRTPLNAIIGFSDGLLIGMSGELNEMQRHDVNCLRDNGVRLLTLINNILDLTRIEAKRAEIIRAPFSPRELASRLEGQMRILAQQKALEFVVCVDSDVPTTLIGAEPQIEQVAVNLLSNAFKFTEKGSVALQISVDVQQQTWTLAVTDTGIGIPPEAQEVIFEEFRQLDSTTTRLYKGSGLGLAITRNLVRIMDGNISVASGIGQGSTFRVSLPVLSSEKTR
jgi:signal transduction histidine kinase